MGKITLIISPSGKGVQTKPTLVYTNDPKRAEFQLIVKYLPFLPKGYRVGSYLFDPTNEVEAAIAPGQTYEGQVGIYFSSDRTVEIKKTVVDNALFTANLEIVTSGREFKLHVKSAAPLPAGVHKAQIKLLTDDPNQDTLEVLFAVKAGNAQPAPVAVKSPAAPKTAAKKPARKK